MSKGLTMKRNFLLGSVALVFVGVSSAAAEDAPLIPDCYAANSQSDFRDCVRRAGGASGAEPMRRSSADQSQQRSANAGYSQGGMGPNATPPPEGMWEREHRRMADDAAAEDPYAGSPREADYGPPPYSDMDGPRSDVDGPQWGPPADSDDPDADGPPGYGPPPAGDDWRGGQMDPSESGPPDDGPDL